MLCRQQFSGVKILLKNIRYIVESLTIAVYTIPCLADKSNFDGKIPKNYFNFFPNDVY